MRNYGLRRVFFLFRFLAYRFILLYDLLTRRQPRHPLPSDMGSILLVELTRIGDVLITTPVIKAVRNKYPGAVINMIVQSGASDIISENPYLNCVTEIKRGRKLARLMVVSALLRKKKIDLVISLSPGIRNSWIAHSCGARYKVGYLNDRSRKPIFFSDHRIEARGFVYEKNISYHQNEHLITRTARAVAPLGIECPDTNLEVFLRPEARIAANRWLKSDHICIAIHPDSGWEHKSWPKKNFVRLIKMIIDRLGYRKVQIIIMGGAEDSKSLKFIADAVEDELSVLQGYPLAIVSSVISRADLFIGNDSGPLHIAEAFETPFVALFGPSLPETTGPLTKGAFIRKEVECSPCHQTLCLRAQNGNKTCMELIEVGEVFESVAEMLQGI